VTIATDDHTHPSRDRYATNASNVGVSLCFYCAHPDRGRFATDPPITDVDVVIARGEEDAGALADRDIVRASVVLIQRRTP
jgi:hypothetical protein